jgi:hypothetical protein
MGHPLGLRGEFEDFCAPQGVDDVVRQIGRTHIGRRRLVDDVARRPAQKIAQERQARLARSGAECGEPVGAELRRVASPPSVARPAVVDADEGRGAQSGAEDGFLLGAEHLKLGGREPHHLALGDRKAGGGQHGHDPLAGHLALKMQRQDQTIEVRAAAAHNPRRQSRRQRPPVRRRPALAPVERDFGFERDVLNDDLFIALMARARLRALQTPDLVLQVLVLALGRRQRGNQLLVLLPKPLDLANQSANHPRQLGRAQAFKRIGR